MKPLNYQPGPDMTPSKHNTINWLNDRDGEGVISMDLSCLIARGDQLRIGLTERESVKYWERLEELDMIRLDGKRVTITDNGKAYCKKYPQRPETIGYQSDNYRAKPYIEKDENDVD